MPSIQLSIDDIELMWQFARRLVFHLNEKASGLSTVGLKNEAATLFGYSGTSGKNLFSKGSKRPPIPRDRMFEFIGKFLSTSGLPDNIKDDFERWRLKIENYYFTLPTSGTAHTSNNVDQSESEISDEELRMAVRKIKQFYDESDFLGFRSESDAFLDFFQLVNTRMKFDNSAHAQESHQEAYIDAITSSSWKWYEEVDKTIVSRILEFNEAGDRGFPVLFNGQDERILNTCNIILSHNQMIFRDDQWPFKDEPTFEVVCFKVNCFDMPERLIGHRLSVNKVTGALHARLVVIEKIGGIIKRNEKDKSKKSAEIPNVIKTILLSPAELGIQITPFDNLHFSLNFLMRDSSIGNAVIIGDPMK